MAIRRWWAGTLGPFWWDDTVALVRYETGSGTFNLGSLGGQSAASVNIDGGEIDATAIGANSPSTGSFTTLAADHLTIEGATANASLTDAGLTSATELGWIEVTISGTSTVGYIRVFSAK